MNSPVTTVAELSSEQSIDRQEVPIAAPIRILTNKSCDFCRRRKRRCDGDGVNPCSRCKALPGGKCTFSQRKLHRSRRTQIRPSSSWIQYGQRRGLLGGGQSLRRCQLSPSPATGLVGTQENSLLKDFFSCMGFIQLVSQNVVREAMVRIMLTSASSSSPASLNGKPTDTEMDEPVREGETAWLQKNADLPMDAGSCSFWSAVAIGGLIQGQPREKVEGYALKAKSALESCANEAMPTELTRAYVQMALLNALTGDKENFDNFVERARAFLNDANAHGSTLRMPQELKDLVRHAHGMKLFLGEAIRKEEMMMFVDGGLSPIPEVGDDMTQEEISRFVMYAYHRTGWAFFKDILSCPNKVDFGPTEVAPLACDFVEPIPSGDNNGFWDNHCHDASTSRDLWRNTGVTLGGENMREAIVDLVPLYERMEKAVERPGIRMGIGGLVINLALCLTRAGRRDMEGAVERASRCVEILVAYPGLLRFDCGFHGSHLMLMFLSRMGSSELYEKIRTVYNKHRLDGNPAIPPMEEWRGIIPCCRHIYCRTSEAMMHEMDARSAKTRIPYGADEAVCIDMSPSDRGSRMVRHAVMDDLTQSDECSDTSPDFFIDADEGIMPRAASNIGVETFFMQPASALAGGMATAPKWRNDLINRSEYDELDGHVLRPEDWRMVADTLERGHIGP